MERAAKAARAVVAVMTAILCALFIWEALDIYLTGSAPENFSAPGVAIEQMYRREDISARLRGLTPAVAVYVLAVIAGSGLCAAEGRRERVRAVRPAEYAPNRKRIRAARAAVAVAAVIFIGLGVWNGGLWDVLVKAVNICTECIGLG